MLGWVRRSRTGKVLAVVAVLTVASCAVRMLRGPVESAEQPAGSLPAAEPGTAAPLTVADAFAHAWLATDEEDWYGGLLPHASASLAAELADVDPARDVPSTEITGEARTEVYSDTMIDIAYPARGGTLRLRLGAPDGRWLVEQVHWRPDR